MSLPYFPMYPTDFEAKTSHLTLEEDGAYNRLLRLMWMTPGCSLPDDDAWIMRRMRVDKETFERVVSVIIDEFCTRENGRVSNAKLTRVFEQSSDAHKKRVSAGSRGGKAKALATKEKGSSNAKAMLKQPEPEPEPEYTHPNGCDTGKPASRFWDDCISVLMEGGVTSDRAARSLLGKWTKVAGRDKVAEIVTQARASPDMVAFIEAAIAEKGETTMEKAERIRRQRKADGYDIKGHW